MSSPRPRTRTTSHVAVRWLREHPDEAAEMGRRGRESARPRLRSVQATRLEALLLDVAGER